MTFLPFFRFHSLDVFLLTVDETLQDNTFTRTGHVSYLKWWEHAEDDVECSVDIKEKTVDVKFSNHIYNWELQDTDDIDLE